MLPWPLDSSRILVGSAYESVHSSIGRLARSTPLHSPMHMHRVRQGKSSSLVTGFYRSHSSGLPIIKMRLHGICLALQNLNCPIVQYDSIGSNADYNAACNADYNAACNVVSRPQPSKRNWVKQWRCWRFQSAGQATWVSAGPLFDDAAQRECRIGRSPESCGKAWMAYDNENVLTRFRNACSWRNQRERTLQYWPEVKS